MTAPPPPAIQNGPPDGGSGADPALTVVVPTRNAGWRLRELLAALAPELDRVTDGCEVILVDDASDDGTWDSILALCAEDPRIRGLRLQRHVGQIGALCAGLTAADGAVVVTMDDDLEVHPRHLHRLVAAVDAGADLASGARIGARSPVRSVGSRLFNARLRRWGHTFADAGCGYNAVTLDLAHRTGAAGWSARQHRCKAVAATLANRVVDVEVPIDRPSTASRYPTLELIGSWLDVEIGFGWLTPGRVRFLALLPAATCAVTAAARAARSMAAREPAALAVLLAVVGRGAAEQALAVHLTVERRARAEPPFRVVEEAGTSAARPPAGQELGA